MCSSKLVLPSPERKSSPSPRRRVLGHTLDGITVGKIVALVQIDDANLLTIFPLHGCSRRPRRRASGGDPALRCLTDRHYRPFFRGIIRRRSCCSSIPPRAYRLRLFFALAAFAVNVPVTYASRLVHDFHIEICFITRDSSRSASPVAPRSTPCSAAAAPESTLRSRVTRDLRATGRGR